jgi:succinyl-CoA synthetase beta subunit
MREKKCAVSMMLPISHEDSCYSCYGNMFLLKHLSGRRWFNLHEYQSKELMTKYGARTQKFKVATRPEEARELAESLAVPELVIKAQIHAGGRGKGTFTSGLKGGVQLTKDLREVEPIVRKMIGFRLMTKQTPPEGVEVKKVMIAEALDIKRETYFAILMDRQTGGPVMVGSPKGGVDIETVAETSPKLIFKVGSWKGSDPYS